MIEVLKSLIADFSHFQEHTIANDLGSPLGFQSTLITSANVAFAGGTATDLNTARRICAAEAIERASFLKAVRSADESQRLLLNEHPTTCGFAAGFEARSTIFRAICEAVERWAWSKWVDEGLGISQCTLVSLTNPLSQCFQNQFDKVLYFSVPLTLSRNLVPDFIPRDLAWTVAIGIKGDGIFPGSRVTTAKDEIWEHPLFEAWRHKLIFENELATASGKDVFEKRIKKFGTQGVDDLARLLEAPSVEFPAAKLRLSEEVATGSIDGKNKYFVHRALCEDYIGWERGDEFRFIY